MSTSLIKTPEAGGVSAHSHTSAHELAKDWLDSMSKNTRRSYMRTIAQFEEWGQQSETPFSAVDAIVYGEQGQANLAVVRYKSYLTSIGKSAATINNRLSAIKSLAKAARLVGASRNTIEVSSVRSKPYRDTSGPGLEAVKQMLKAANSDRDRAIVHLLYNPALRRAEVVSLNVCDIDFVSGVLTVKRKGYTERKKKPAVETTMQAIRKWLSQHPDPRPDAPLFVSLSPNGYGKRLSDKTVERVVKSLGEKVGVKTTPHGIRHTAITTALEATNGDIQAVMDMSDHANPRTLFIYDDNRRKRAKKVCEILGNVLTSGE